jgi:hypothetical protein
VDSPASDQVAIIVSFDELIAISNSLNFVTNIAALDFMP